MSDSKAWPQAHRPKPIIGAVPLGQALNFTDSHKLINEFVNVENELHIDGAYFYRNESYYSTKIPVISKAISKAKVSTKVCPMYKDLGLSAQGVKEQFAISLDRLQRDCVDILYLHWIDTKTDINETLRAINDLYLQRKFKRFGVSNFYSWQVSQIYYICKRNNYVLPTVYQGCYNPICRDIEAELLPCLRYTVITYAS